MTPIEPAVLLVLLLATIYGGLAHILWGQRWRHLAIFWGLAFAGCFSIYVFGLHPLGTWPAPAGVPLIEATVAAWALLLIASHGRV